MRRLRESPDSNEGPLPFLDHMPVVEVSDQEIEAMRRRVHDLRAASDSMASRPRQWNRPLRWAAAGLISLCLLPLGYGLRSVLSSGAEVPQLAETAISTAAAVGAESAVDSVVDAVAAEMATEEAVEPSRQEQVVLVADDIKVRAIYDRSFDI